MKKLTLLTLNLALLSPLFLTSCADQPVAQTTTTTTRETTVQQPAAATTRTTVHTGGGY